MRAQRKLAGLLLAGLAASSCARRVETASDFNLAADLERRGESIQLHVEELAALPDGTVFLAGAYLLDAGTFRSALLVSRDEGVSFQEAGPSCEGCTNLNLRTLSPSHVWAIATFTQEGVRSPQTIIMSGDAGRTWAATEVDFLTLREPLDWVARFFFDDARHGLLSVHGSLGGVETFRTDDGGRSWRRLWTVRRRPEDVDYDSPEPPASCAFIGDHGYVRFRQTDEAVIIEKRSSSDASSSWSECSRIPRSFRLKNGKLVAEGPRP